MSAKRTDKTPPSHDGAAGKPDKPDKDFVVHIDRQKYTVDHSPATGAELRALAGLGTDVDLYLEAHGDAEDELVDDPESIPLKNGMHFYSTPPQHHPGPCLTRCPTTTSRTSRPRASDTRPGSRTG